MNSMSKYLFDQVHNVCQEVEDSLTEYYRKETQECKVMTSRLVSQYVQRSEKKLKTQKELRNELIPEMETPRFLILAEEFECSSLFDEFSQTIADKATLHIFDTNLTCPLLPPHTIKTILARAGDSIVQQVRHI